MLKAAENSIVGVEAQIRVALQYKNGEGVNKNLPKAIYWLENAAIRNFLEAMHIFYKVVGYDDGDGLSLNIFMTNNSMLSISNIKKSI